MRITTGLLLCSLLAACAQSRRGDGDPLPATVVHVPARTVLALTVGIVDEAAVERFALAIEDQGIPPAGDLIIRGDTLLIPVTDGVAVDPPLRRETMPAMRVAAMVVSAPSLGAIDGRIGKLYEWIEANGYRDTGPPLRVITGFPPDGWTVEVLIPVETAGSSVLP